MVFAPVVEVEEVPWTEACRVVWSQRIEADDSRRHHSEPIGVAHVSRSPRLIRLSEEVCRVRGRPDVQRRAGDFRVGLPRCLIYRYHEQPCIYGFDILCYPPFLRGNGNANCNSH